MRVLILGGTTEGSTLARLLAGRPRIEAVLSLAGRTANPAPAPIPMRVGGYGGAEGLARHLSEAGIDAVIDATHPFAARMSVNAAEACARLRIPLLRLIRPPWVPAAGDRWIDVLDMAGAAGPLTDPDPPKEGEIVYADREKVLCRRWNWRQDMRSLVTPLTHRAVITVQSNGEGDLDAAVADLTGLIQRFCGGEGHAAIADHKQPVVEIIG